MFHDDLVEYLDALLRSIHEIYCYETLLGPSFPTGIYYHFPLVPKAAELRRHDLSSVCCRQSGESMEVNLPQQPVEVNLPRRPILKWTWRCRWRRAHVHIYIFCDVYRFHPSTLRPTDSLVAFVNLSDL